MFPFPRKPDARPDEQDQSTGQQASQPTGGQADPAPSADASPEAEAGTVSNPLRRTDLTSPGLRGVTEKIVLGSATQARVMSVLAVIATLGLAVFFGYRHWVGFNPDGDFFNPGLAIMVFGAHLAQSFVPREPERQPHVGFTAVNAVQTAVVGYVAFVLATEPLDRKSVMFLVSYGSFALVSMLIGFIVTTTIRRRALVLAEEAADEGDRDALRRALHMDR